MAQSRGLDERRGSTSVSRVHLDASVRHEAPHDLRIHSATAGGDEGSVARPVGLVHVDPPLPEQPIHQHGVAPLRRDEEGSGARAFVTQVHVRLLASDQAIDDVNLQRKSVPFPRVTRSIILVGPRHIFDINVPQFPL